MDPLDLVTGLVNAVYFAPSAETYPKDNKKLLENIKRNCVMVQSQHSKKLTQFVRNIAFFLLFFSDY